MPNEIISYLEMCQREGISLQRGMNFRIGENHSVILMSVRRNAPYLDRIEDDGSTIIYEGHDIPRSSTYPDPKMVDQQEKTPNGSLTENGKFKRAAELFISEKRPPERVRVYEKIKQGIWSYNGVFHLIGSWVERDNIRNVFKFKLTAVEEEASTEKNSVKTETHRRIIPTNVKIEVWKRDKGKCVICGATTNLHFDHIIPYSKGGSSQTPDNIQILCGKHNILKRDKIE